MRRAYHIARLQSAVAETIMSESYLFHGARLDSVQIQETLDHLFRTNLALQEQGRRATPVCIWGMHGIGKTALVQDYCARKGWQIAYCAPAQFEEMGDLHGLPTRVDPDPEVIGDEYTTFLPPDWVPTEEGPGILLLDDLNRADDRILRGLMQLLQNFEMFSWALPPKWQIVATANPEGGDYSVTPMDDAMLTRMLHLTMRFDVRAWAAWALKEGVDPRGVDFVLTYPEVITGARTTPRTLTQFFEQIGEIEDLKANFDLVHVLAMSALDEVTVAAFMAHVNDDLSALIDPSEILDAPKFEVVAKRVVELAQGKDQARRVDRLSTICTRLYLHLTQADYRPGPTHTDNLVQFLLLDVLPNDLRVSLHRDLSVGGHAKVREMVKDARLSLMLLDGI